MTIAMTYRYHYHSRRRDNENTLCVMGLEMFVIVLLVQYLKRCAG